MALIDHGRKFIFVHVRKTGGTSIVNCLKGHTHFKRGKYKNGLSHGVSLAHHTSHMIQKKYPQEWKNYFTFSIVRNRWADYFHHISCQKIPKKFF